MSLRFRILAVAVAWLLAGGAALAQSGDAAWPDRPLKLIVPFPAGSSTDIIARLLGQRLATKLGQQVVIENRVGASGSIGADAVAKAAPDGYTLGIATASTHALAMSLNTNLPYDPVKDFAPVGMIGGQPYVLVIYPGLGPKTLGELIALAKTKPGTLNYGSAGVASLAHLAAALFANQAGISLTHVPYKSSAQSVTDMIAGRLDMQFATIAPTLANIRDGKLRALATSGAKRSAALPDVPTVAESGLPGYEAVLWVAMVTPAGTPTAITTRLNRELNDILKAADTREALAAQGVEAEPGTPDAVTQRIKTDIDKWRGVVAKSGIKR
ncbi:MAG: Bug family tripartite tricarboxylate transporter substrate binding protein [Xanthobacteraceae bacterium]